MIRLTKRVFTDLAIYMIGFGIVIGVCFPIFLHLLGVSDELAFNGVSTLDILLGEAN